MEKDSSGSLVRVDISPLGSSRLPMLAFYRLLILQPGDARSLIALCPRGVLFTHSTVGCWPLTCRTASGSLFSIAAGFDRACKKAKLRGILFTHLRAV